jgi:hypothetical protein
LFWKKRNKSDDIVSFESNDARTSFRVSPLSTEPITLEFNGRPVLLKNIGAAGIAFENRDFMKGDSQPVTFILPGENVPVSAEAQIVEIDSDGVCHCGFAGLSEEDYDAIHRYMLAVQIQEIRNKRSKRKTPQPEHGAAQAKGSREFLKQT